MSIGDLSSIPNCKAIDGFPGYFVSDDGRVWTQKKGGNKNGAMRSDGKVKRLKTHVNRHGYETLTLCKDNVKFWREVHRLVLDAFVGVRPEGMVCRHLDGNSHNSVLSNLTWGTPKENSQDAVRHRTLSFGSKRYNAKFDERDIVQVRLRYKNGETLKQISETYGASFSTISCIVLRKTWTHVE